MQGCTRLATHGLKASKAQIDDCLIRCVKSVAALSSIQCTQNLRTCWAKQCRVNSISWTKAAKEINGSKCDLQHCRISMCGLAGLLFCVVVRTLRSTWGSITFYRPPCNLGSMIFRKIFPDCKYPAFFLRFAAGIADDKSMTKQPIMIRVVVVCPVTGCYRVVWQPLCAPRLYPVL